jgi:sugar phosphate isomerase/epimerase
MNTTCHLMLMALLLAPATADPGSNLDTKNLVAWCIVPFDAAKRGPAARAKMLDELGIRRCAYDWRDQHVAEFEDEIIQYKKRGIEFFAFWGSHEAAFALFEKYDLHPQIWQTAPSPENGDQAEKVKSATDAMEALAKRSAELGCKLGLYNHGGWGGEPANLVAVCKELRSRGYAHVGIVYNWHHGHGHVDDWEESLTLMQPYLLCVNINGMNRDAAPKILPLAQGEYDLAMLRTLVDSGYLGPVGVLDHQEKLDSKIALADNLDGLSWLRKELEKPSSGGPKPEPRQNRQPGERQR